jgi:hypothetical protein
MAGSQHKNEQKDNYIKDNVYKFITALEEQKNNV